MSIKEILAGWQKVDQISVAQCWERWQAVVNKVMNISVP
jgi:hypothetical protein